MTTAKYRKNPFLRREFRDRATVWIQDCPFCDHVLEGEFRYVVEIALKNHRDEKHPGRKRQPPPPLPKPDLPPPPLEPVDAVAWARDREFESLKNSVFEFIIDYKAVPGVPEQVTLIVENPRSRRVREIDVEVTRGRGRGGLNVKILRKGQWYSE